MAIIAVSTGVAAAQESEAFNQASPEMQQVIRDERALHEESEGDSARQQPKLPLSDPGPISVNTGTIADASPRWRDLEPVQVATPEDLNSMAKRTDSVDWELLQQAAAALVFGLVVGLVGRGLRYILSNE